MNYDLSEIFKTAILNEVEGQKFYELAATQAHSIEAKESLLELAREEELHQHYLKAELEHILDNAAPIHGYEELVLPNPNIYNWGKVDSAELGMAVSVYKIGMQMEKDAVEFYKDCKVKSEDDARLAMLFDKLIHWENQHYELFKKQYEQYRDMYWADQQFAPF